MVYGLLDLPWWGFIVVAAVFTHVTTIAVTLYLHRSQAHRAVDFHPIVSHFFRLWLWLSTGMETKAWAAIHRKHHAKCETEADPHSPQILGIKTVLLQGAELYRKEAKNKETSDRYGHGTPNDWIERKLYTPHSAKGILLMLLINTLLFGLPGITIWAIQMMWIPFTAAGIINGIGHYWGYRNYECHDAARNIVPWGVILVGEELHNNHHTFATSARLSSKWWEFDLGWMYISLLKLVGMAKVKRLAPKLSVVKHKAQIDVDTLTAMFTNRFQVWASYSKQVIMPTLTMEKLRAKDGELEILARAKSVLLRTEHVIDEAGKAYLSEALSRSQALTQAYVFRQKLVEIWDKTTASQKEMLEALQQWCHQAESSSLETLRAFALSIRQYSMAQ